jgi:hypothetical protein
MSFSIVVGLADHNIFLTNQGLDKAINTRHKSIVRVTVSSIRGLINFKHFACCREKGNYLYITLDHFQNCILSYTSNRVEIHHTFMDPNRSILIIGAGTFGLSTAYHLAKAGYKNITVLEKASSIPPTLSAANDYNKIIRAEYEDPWYSELALARSHYYVPRLKTA